MTRLRLTNFDQLAILRPANRQAGTVTANSNSTTDDDQPYESPTPAHVPSESYIEHRQPLRQNRLDVLRDHLVGRRTQFETMDAPSLELEIIALTESVEFCRVDLAAHNADPQHSSHDAVWVRRAERALAGLRTDLTLAHTVMKRHRTEAHQQMLAEQAAAKVATQTHIFNAVFVQRAKAILAPEVYRSIFEAAKQVAKPGSSSEPELEVMAQVEAPGT